MRYVNFKKKTPPRVLGEWSSWAGLESILADLIDTYGVGRKKALEFGVEYGYSTIALSGFFDQVVGVDTFAGDIHSGEKEEYERASRNCAPYENITLVKADYRDFITTNDEQYDLIHIDIVHMYEDTLACGAWAVEHAPVVIFHDTESFTDVMKAVQKLSNGSFDNYPLYNGLGIVYRPL